MKRGHGSLQKFIFVVGSVPAVSNGNKIELPMKRIDAGLKQGWCQLIV